MNSSKTVGKGLFTPWTMKSSQGVVESVIGFELVPGSLQFTPRKKCQDDHGVQGPQKTYFKTYIIR